MDKAKTHCRPSSYKAEIKSVKTAEALRETVDKAKRQCGHGPDKGWTRPIDSVEKTNRQCG